MRDRIEVAGFAALLRTLPGWSLMADRPAITGRFTFRDFKSAFAFMTEVAAEAERIDHHPEWRNVWNRVDIVLTTHSAKGLTELDRQLAAFINHAAAKNGARPNP